MAFSVPAETKGRSGVAIRRMAEASCERVLGALLAEGPLLPPADPSLLEAINTMARMNLARAWTIEPAGLG